MNILLTNDDGIDSPGLRLLADALRKKTSHRVLVLAPDTDCSGFSHSIRFLWNPIKISPRDSDAWACSGSPADCVIMALLGALPVKPDLVISGINRGANMGTDLVYSGTAAAARQAGLSGIPAIALSLAGMTGEFYWDMAVSWAVDHFEELRNIWRSDTFVNVNIPNSPGGPEGMVNTFPSRMSYHDKLAVYKAQDGNSWCFVEFGTADVVPAPGSDREAVSKNLAAVSPVFVHPVNGPGEG
ncbi:MAG: 5'/3'-nucleotidase SurE [Treponema sp.]|jgi:5'-nucleotidase|nr:5'/3'-nucleotidase SurE [Treponema sp.]